MEFSISIRDATMSDAKGNMKMKGCSSCKYRCGPPTSDACKGCVLDPSNWEPDAGGRRQVIERES